MITLLLRSAAGSGWSLDHNIFQDNLVGVDFCERMVKETNPSVWAKAEKTAAPHAADHGYRTIGDIMTALNPFTGEFYRETLIISRLTREMFCLMERRHTHPSTLYPGGVGTTPSNQLFTEYLTRLATYTEFMKKCVPLHDDLFNFSMRLYLATNRWASGGCCSAAGAPTMTGDDEFGTEGLSPSVAGAVDRAAAEVERLVRAFLEEVS